ncbi:hypothetical protein Tco_1446889 [Tanacetum coccineum]
MNPIVAQQTALENALFAPDNRVKIRKCNIRISPFKKPKKEPTYQVILDALALSPCYPTFLITTEVREIYMQQFWFTISKIKYSSSYQLSNQEFDEPPFDEEIVSSRNLATKEIFDQLLRYLQTTCTNHGYPLLPSSTNAFLGKPQIDNRDSSAKRQENMPYPRFIKAIIQHFISKDKSISIRNRMFMHTVRDVSVLGSLKFVAKSEDNQVYGALIPEAMINLKIQNSNSYKTYLAFATGVLDAPKGKSIDTHERTGLKLGVPDVSKADSSDNDEEYDHINEEMYDDANVELKDAELADVRKGDEEMNVAEKKRTLPETKTASKSFNKHPKHKALYHALMESILVDEDAMDQCVADEQKKRKPADDDRDKDPPAGPDQGLKRRKTSRDVEPSKKVKLTDTSKGTTKSQPKSTGKSAQVEKTVFEAGDTQLPHNLGEDMGKTDEPLIVKVDPKDWFKKPKRPPTPDLEWNTGKIVNDAPTQNWLSDLAKAEKPFKTFNELMSTPIDFTAFSMNHLQISDLTKADLVGPIYNLLKGTCKSYVELEYNIEECYKALNDQLDWNNPEGDRYSFYLSKPLPLVESRNHLIVLADYFFNNDLAYLQGGSTDRTNMTSLTKMKAAKYDLKGIEDMVPTLWSPIKVVYDKHANLAVTNVKVNIWYGYGHLEDIEVRISDQQLYKFIEGDFPRLHLNYIEDMLLLVVNNRLFNLKGEDIMHLDAALHTLHDMATNLRMGYNKAMPKRRWSNLNKTRLTSCQNWRDLPRDIPLDKIEVLIYDTKGVKVRKGKMQTKTELTLEQTQQGVSDEVLVSIEGVEE